jgi:hypothetical protein
VRASAWIAFVAAVSSVSSSAWAHKVGDLAWCYMPTTLHLECLYRDDASCEVARKTISDYMKKSGRSFKNAPDEAGAKALEPACVHNPDHQGGPELFETHSRVRGAE